MLFLHFYNQFVYFFFVFLTFCRDFLRLKYFLSFGLLPFKYEARRKNIAKFLLTNFAAPSSLLLTLTT